MEALHFQPSKSQKRRFGFFKPVFTKKTKYKRWVKFLDLNSKSKSVKINKVEVKGGINKITKIYEYKV